MLNGSGTECMQMRRFFGSWTCNVIWIWCMQINTRQALGFFFSILLGFFFVIILVKEVDDLHEKLTIEMNCYTINWIMKCHLNLNLNWFVHSRMEIESEIRKSDQENEKKKKSNHWTWFGNIWSRVGKAPTALIRTEPCNWSRAIDLVQGLRRLRRLLTRYLVPMQFRPMNKPLCQRAFPCLKWTLGC